MNKEIKRTEASTKIFNDRSLTQDYKTVAPLLREGLHVLDVGCGTGAISKDMAACVGKKGSVTGIDNTERFIQSGQETYRSLSNLKLIHADLFTYTPEHPFDLIVSARTLQWLSNPAEAIQKFKSWLQPGGILSVLDYDHTAIVWQPAPPPSMRLFYQAFLKWRADAGMDNKMAEALPRLFAEAGFTAIEVFDAAEISKKGDGNFKTKLGIWSKVAASTQMVEEGYIKDTDRRKAIEDYNAWIESTAEEMVLKLKDVQGRA